MKPNGLPTSHHVLAEREAVTAKVEATTRQHGIQAGRDMMRALGMPMVPDELCDPVKVLEPPQAAVEMTVMHVIRRAPELGPSPGRCE